MPLVRIDLRQGTSPEYRKAIADGVHQAMIEALAIPPDDRFQVITEHPPEGLIFDPQYLGVQRSDKVVFVQITMSTGRKPQQKRKLFKRIAELLGASRIFSLTLWRSPGRIGRSATEKPSTWTRNLPADLRVVLYSHRMHFFKFFSLAAVLSLCALLLSVVAAGPQAVNTRFYLGFDRNDYPGDDALPVLRKTFSFTGYWIGPPPGEKRSTWLGKRALLQSQGFGFVVLWNGRASRNLKSASDAHRKGKSDVQNAAKSARQEGFPAGTVIFLDIEEGGRLSAVYHDYVHAWIDTLAQERFRAGVYCSAVPVDEGGGVSITTAQDLQDQLAGRKLLIFWVFNDACPPAPGCSFLQIPPPVAESGFTGAAVWQYAQSPRRKERTAHCTVKYAADGNCYAPGDTGQKWFLDADVAASPDPSAAKE
jgi:phenylpyruvate tautomerase PptA (4-oxalocrotonate tautomerase family)